jgi:membrane fusion protein, copper/silver efflux system
MINIVFIMILTFAVFGFECNQNEASGNTVNTDTTITRDEHASMHHHASNDTVGVAPMENMDMPDSTAAETSDTYWNALPTNYSVIANQQIVQPVNGSINYSPVANGYVTVDNRRNKKVSVRVGGRIERLYIKYNYQYIHKGEKILELYSPELNTYIEEFRFILRSKNDSLLLTRAKQKLLLLGLNSAQISQISKSEKPLFTISIYSPYEGYVLFNPSTGSNMPTPNLNPSGMGSMNGSDNVQSSAVSSLPDNSIREGMYLNKDQTIFWINDFRQMLGILAFNKNDEKYIRKGQNVVIESELLPDQTFRSSIQLIEPVYEKGQHFTQARVYLNNPNRIIKQNSLLKATVFIDVHSLLIERTSVQYLGKAAIVWVKTASTKDGSYVFQSRAVRLGRISNGMIEVLQGLNKDEWIAKDAAYLTDSETIIKY